MGLLKTDVNDDLDARLREIARQHERSIAAEIRVAVRKHVAECEVALGMARDTD